MIPFFTALIILLFFSCYFSSAETALFSLSPLKIKAYRTSADPRRRLIADLLMQPRDLLVTVFMLNTLVNVLIQNVFSSMVGTGASWALKVGLPLILTLFLGEILPKYVGLLKNVTIAYRVAPSIHFFQMVLKPLRKAVITITAPISRALFFFLKQEESISNEELQHVLNASEKEGLLQPDEAKMVWGYLELQEATVKEVMLPREDMLAHDIAEPLNKLTYLFADKKLNDVAIYEKDSDNIIGILSAKQYFLNRDIIQKPSDLRQFLHRPFYIPENAPARYLFRRFEENHQAIAIVVDEYGANSGMVLREDIVALMLGVAEEEDLLFTRASKHEIIASGKMELSIFNEIFDCNLESQTNMVTIGGWLIEQLGDIPKSGTKYETKDFLFQVLAAEPKRVRRIYVRKLNSPPRGGKR